MVWDQIFKQRMLIYFLIIGVIPILGVLLYNHTQAEETVNLMESIDLIREKAVQNEKKQAVNMAVRNYYREADHFYIDKYLETLTFLEPEIESLQKTLSNKTIAEDEQNKKRLEQLTGSANSLSFTEGVVQSSPNFQETTETLVRPVEINGADLQKILAYVEGIEIGPYQPALHRPQLMILDFKLDRKTNFEKSEVFTLNMKLLKREYL